jgi:hypothetical protein
MTQFHPFRGLDLRAGQADAAGFLQEARNIVLDGVGRALRRPALRFRGLLDPAAGRDAGLYACGDQLRQVVMNATYASTYASNDPDAVYFRQFQDILAGFTARSRDHAINGTPETSATPQWPGPRPAGMVEPESFYWLPSWVHYTSQLTTVDGYTYDVYSATSDKALGAVVTNMTNPGNPMMPTLSFDYLKGNQAAGLEVLGATADALGRSVVLVKHGDGANKLHRAVESGYAPSGATELTPGFTPAVALLRAVGRIWTMDANNRFLRYSGIDDASGADPDFVTGKDLAKGAGFIDVSLLSPGSGSPQAIATQGNRVVVFYRGALLIYAVDFDQLRNYLDSAVVGPGTNAPRSIVEIGGDLVFLSDTGVRSLTNVQRSLDQTEDSVFGRVDALARELADNATVQPVGHYARRLGAYLLAFGNEVLVLPFIAGSQVLGWTRWTLPIWARVTGMADSQGQTFVRIEHPDGRSGLFSLDEALDDDQDFDGGVSSIPVLVEPVPMRSTTPVAVRFISASGTEAIQVQVVTDGRPELAPDGSVQGRPIVLPPRSPVPARAAVGRRGLTVSARVFDAAAKAGWRLDGLWIDTDKRG